VNQLDVEVLFPWGNRRDRLGDILLFLNQLLSSLAAFSGLATENMTRGPGWHFLDMGRRIERALHSIHLVERLLVPVNQPLGGSPRYPVRTSTKVQPGLAPSG
jgi:uncharacterized alpha-E superfamily protein